MLSVITLSWWMNVPFSSVPRDSLSAVRKQKHQKVTEVSKSPLLYGVVGKSGVIDLTYFPSVRLKHPKITVGWRMGPTS